MGVPRVWLTPELWGSGLAGSMLTMSKYPRDFRDDVVAVARRDEAPLKQVATDFGTSESRLADWLEAASEEAVKPAEDKRGESAELRELRKRNRLPEQENEVLRRSAAYLSRNINDVPAGPRTRRRRRVYPCAGGGDLPGPGLFTSGLLPVEMPQRVLSAADAYYRVL